MNTLELDTADIEALRSFWDVYESVSEEVNASTRLRAEAIPEFVSILRSMSEEDLKARQLESHENQRRALIEGDWGPYAASLRDQGSLYARMGVSFRAWFQLLTSYRAIVIRAAVERYGPENPQFQLAIAGMSRFLDIGLSIIGEAYLETKEDTIRKQQLEILELSTPVLQLSDRLLILPLIGLVDTHRARRLTEGLLNTIKEKRAKVIVMDITGVPVVDSKVANHLVQTVEAARLMGARVILTGMSPGIAQTLVALGADLPNVHTLSDLQEGVEEANRMLSATL